LVCVFRHWNGIPIILCKDKLDKQMGSWREKVVALGQNAISSSLRATTQCYILSDLVTIKIKPQNQTRSFLYNYSDENVFRR
jgi:hypothetical protein